MEYLPDLASRKQTVQEQITEFKRIYYRNNLENLEFIKQGNKHKQTEVKTNNEILKEKLDLLSEELERLNNETGSNSSE